MRTNYDQPADFQPEILTEERLARLSADLDKFLIEPGTGGKEQRVIANILSDVKSDEHQTFVAPVGSGKTLGLAPSLLLGEKETRPNRVIVVEPTQQLTANASDLLGQLYGDDIVGHRYGGLDSSRKRNTQAPILVVTTGMFWNMIRNHEIGPNDYAFFDEIHLTLQFPQIEAAAAALNTQRNKGSRVAGLGFATGTFPVSSPEGKEFLDFTESELLATGEKTKWKREILPGGEEILPAVKNYLADPLNDGRNLLVMVPTNKKVADIAGSLNEWLETSQKPSEERSWSYSSEAKKPSQSFRVVFFSKDIGAGEFNAQISQFLRDRATARRSGQTFNEKLVIVATYGSAGSGVNYPVEDAIGDATYIKAVDEDKQSTSLQAVGVSGNVLAQAMGRIGRYADGRFFLVGYHGQPPLDELTRLEPPPKPLNSQKGLQEAIFGLLEGNFDPREIHRWYSNVDTRAIEKTFALLAARGLLKEGKITEIASKISANPLSNESLEWALTVETTTPELQAGLQEILSTADSASWRSLFVKEFINDKDRSRRVDKTITSILLEKGLLRQGENSTLLMPDSNEPLPQSDTAILLNVAKYLRDTQFEVAGDKGVKTKRRLNVGELASKYNLSYKALERLFTSLVMAQKYNHDTGRSGPGYFTQANWNPYIRKILESGSAVALEVGNSRNNKFSDGIYRDQFNARSGRYGNSEIVASLKVTTASGVGATSGFTFTGSVLGKVPEDLIPWLPENLAKRIAVVTGRFEELDRSYLSSKSIEYYVREMETKFADYPNVLKFIKSCNNVLLATKNLNERAKNVPVFKISEWFKEFVIPHMVAQRIDTLEGLDGVFAKLEDAGISITPNLFDFASAKRIEEIDRKFPTSVSFQGLQLPITYSDYDWKPYVIEFPAVNVGVTAQGFFALDSHPLHQAGAAVIRDHLKETDIVEKIKISLFGHEVALKDVLSWSQEKIDAYIVYTDGLSPIAKSLSSEQTVEISKEPTEEQFYGLLGGVSSRFAASHQGQKLGVISRPSGTYDGPWKLEYEGIKPKDSDAKGELSTEEDFFKYFLENTDHIVRLAFGKRIDEAKTYLTGLSQLPFKEASSSAGNAVNLYQLNEQIHGYIRAEVERLLVNCQGEVVENLFPVNSELRFNVDGLRSIIEGFFQEVSDRGKAIEAASETFTKLRQVAENGDQMPSSFKYDFDRLFESYHFFAKPEEFNAQFSALRDRTEYLTKRYESYRNYRSGLSPGDVKLSFETWFHNKEHLFEAIPKIREAVPLIFNEQGKNYPGVYLIKDDQGNYQQYVFSEEDGFRRRKGYNSQKTSVTLQGMLQYFSEAKVGKRGEGLKYLTFEIDDVLELEKRGIKVGSSSVENANYYSVELDNDKDAGTKEKIWVIDANGDTRESLNDELDHNFGEVATSALVVGHWQVDTDERNEEKWKTIRLPPLLTDAQKEAIEKIEAEKAHTFFSGVGTGWDLAKTSEVSWKTENKRELDDKGYLALTKATFPLNVAKYEISQGRGETEIHFKPIMIPEEEKIFDAEYLSQQLDMELAYAENNRGNAVDEYAKVEATLTAQRSLGISDGTLIKAPKFVWTTSPNSNRQLSAGPFYHQPTGSYIVLSIANWDRNSEKVEEGFANVIVEVKPVGSRLSLFQKKMKVTGLTNSVDVTGYVVMVKAIDPKNYDVKIKSLQQRVEAATKALEKLKSGNG